jgi:hypothetical protein
MEMLNATFSVNQYDEDGDSFDECVLIHLNNGVILRFNDVNEVDQFAERLTKLTNEIRG